MAHTRADNPSSTDVPLEDLDAGARERLEADLRLTMSERLAKVHELCKQLTAIASRTGDA